MSTVIPNVFTRLLDTNGNPVPGGKMYWYVAGTSTPATVYSDSATTVPLANPIVADSSGALVPIYAKDGSYKIVLSDASGATLYSLDNYTIVTPGGGSLVSSPVVLKTANYTVQSTDRNGVIIVDASAAPGQNIVITADSSGLTNGFPFSVVNVGSVGTVTIAAVGGQTINQSASFTLTSQNQSASFVSNGASGWIIDASTVGSFINAVTFFAASIFKAQVQYAEQTLAWVSSPSTTTFNPAAGADAVITLIGASMNMGPIANQLANVGSRGVIRIIQDATGGRTITWDSSWVCADGTPPFIASAANAETRFAYWVKSASVTVLTAIMPNGYQILLNTITGSGVTSVQDTTSITSAYRYYRIELENCVPAATATYSFQPQVSGTFQTAVQAAVFYSDPNVNGNSGIVGGSNNSTGTFVQSVGTLANAGVSGFLTISNPSASTIKTINAVMGSPYSNNTQTQSYQASLSYLTAGAITGFKLVCSGNSSWTVKVYGWN